MTSSPASTPARRRKKKDEVSVAEVALKMLNRPPPFICEDCQKNPAWFDPRFGKAICDSCWKANNYAQQIMEAYPENKGQIEP